MPVREKIYFASDVHLGLRRGDPSERERRFVDFLRGIDPESTAAVYLLGDIWDFWYEYRDVVPKGYVRLFAALTDLMDAGVEVVFCPGNHDIWCYSYFEELGMKVVRQPYLFEAGGKTFCIGHGDGLGPGQGRTRALGALFRNRVAQTLFSLLHPWLAFRLGLGWSGSNRRRHLPYFWKGTDEPLYKWASAFSGKVDFFVFGHFHCEADETLPSGARLLVADSWLERSPFILFDGSDIGPHSL